MVTTEVYGGAAKATLQNKLLVSRGCTVVHTLTLQQAAPPGEIGYAIASYAQYIGKNRTIVLEKELPSVRFLADPARIVIPLTQRDTLMFARDGAIQMQVRMRYDSGGTGRWYKTQIVEGVADDAINDNVLGGE